ncbi:MAG TPA: chemotaxis protein CheW [Patescibacteria group bacterium]|nr:chemotaxis protein CheW [Patescibacteria group bacterium]
MTRTAAEAAAADGSLQYVTLGVDSEIFAVDVEDVREILDMRAITRIPNAPSFLLGMIDVRGRAVPVIDLRAKLGLPPIAANDQTRIVVLETVVGEAQLVLGLLADRVFEVTPLDSHSVEPPPDIGVRWQSDYIRGIARRGADFVIILKLGRLFSSEEAALIGGGR